jgi:hypothetical protein
MSRHTNVSHEESTIPSPDTLATDKEVTCNWQGEEVKVGDERCFGKKLYVCKPDGRMQPTGKAC